jgi:hypothetical protein
MCSNPIVDQGKCDSKTMNRTKQSFFNGIEQNTDWNQESLGWYT